MKILSKLGILKIEDIKFPSYISANNISLAVMDVLNPEKRKLTLDELRALIETKLAGNKEIKDLLLTILDNFQGKIENFISGIEMTYNDCMGRATGWFKRQAQLISFILSLIVVITFNIDTIKIVKTLQADKNLLNNAVNAATDYLNKQSTDLDK